jgi:NAD+ kinase
MKVAIYSRGTESVQTTDLQMLLDELQKAGITPVIWNDFLLHTNMNLSNGNAYAKFYSDEELDDSFTCLISLGGDGTLLDTLTLVKDKQIPVMGINFGRLGFLSTIGKEALAEAVAALAAHTFIIDRRSLVHVQADIPIFSNAPFGLNEFSIHKRDTSSMIKIHTYLNGEFLNTYWADGLIVSTPTGSTGYSLSCAGPVVFPDAGSFVITPVAPHNLSSRPIVVPDSTIISFEVESRIDEFICSLDSRREIVSTRVQLAVKKEPFQFGLVRLSENTFLQTLRNKLSWGLDTRN